MALPESLIVELSSARVERYSAPLPSIVLVLAVVLFVYLPLEPVVLAVLPESEYWVWRLAPDGLIFVVTITALVLDRTLPGLAQIGLVTLAGVMVALVGANSLRGFDWTVTVNALRVIIRYVPLGILLAAYTTRRSDIPRRLVAAALIMATIQIFAGLLEVLTRLGFPPADVRDLLVIDGTTGRYDRFGLLMAIALVVILGALTRARGPRQPALYAALVAGIVLLGLSTSRQACVGLAVGATPFVLLPRIGRVPRALGMMLLGIGLALPFFVPAVSAVEIPQGDDIPPATAPATPRPPVTTRGASNLSFDPNKNFRLFLTLRLAPWAAATEPFLGFGPGAHDDSVTDPRLERFVEESGTTWAWASRFTNDSNYASLVIQFGLPLTIGFLGLVFGSIAYLIRRAYVEYSSFAVLSLSVSLVVATAALFGPAFEIRTASIYLWCLLPTAAVAATMVSRRT